MEKSDIIIGLFVLLGCVFISAKSEDSTTTENSNVDDSNFDSYYQIFENYHRFNLSEQNINCVINILKQDNILV